MKIWIHINDNQEGPFEQNELPLDRMDAETPVWYDGLAGWMPAGQAPLTAPLFAPAAVTAAPVAAQGSVESAEQTAPRTYIIWSLLLTICCCNPVGLVALILGNVSSTKWRNHDYAGAQKYATMVEWWLMITIVTALMISPIILLMYS